MKFQCDCSKKDCILQSEDILNEYRKNAILSNIFEMRNKIYTDCKFYDFEIRTPNYDTNFNTRYKCGIVKQAIKLICDLQIAQKANNDFMEQMAVLEDRFDKHNDNLKKYIKIFIKKIINYKNFEKENIKLKAELKNVKDELKTLRRENRKLKKTENKNKKESDDDFDKIIQDNSISHEDKKKTQEIHEAQENILQIYEDIKYYLYNRKSSITRLAADNNINDIGEFRNKFFNIKNKRINKAHPKPRMIIKNDDEFIKIINSL